MDNLMNENEFIRILHDKFERNEHINLTVTGNSMVPFLVDKRDTAILSPPEDKIRKGDILFYKRINGKFVFHRVKKVTSDGIFFIGDSQKIQEGPLDKSFVLAKCDSVIRKGKLIDKKSIIWKFFRVVWLNIIPLRVPLIKFIAKFKKVK